MQNKLFHENEVRTNEMAARAVLGLALGILVFAVLGRLGIFNIGPEWVTGILLIASAALILCYAKVKSDNFDKPYVKYLILFGLIITCGAMYFLYPATTSFLLYGPILISIKYYDKKFALEIAAMSWIVCIFTLILNTVMYNSFEFFREFKMFTDSYMWSDVSSVVAYFIVPRTMLFILTAIIAYYITDDGKQMISNEITLLSQAVENEKELIATAEIQKNSLMPLEYESPDKEVNISAYIKSAKEIGGDFYDYFRLNDNLRVCLIADVSDKGLSAAVFGMQVKTVLRYTLMSNLGEGSVKGIESIDLEKAVTVLNNVIVQYQSNGLFVTAFIVCMDTRTGVGKFINAGHAQPYIIHPDGSYELIDTDPQLFMGAIPNTEYKASVLNLNKDDILLMYTDGVTDARNLNDEMYGQERIEKLIDRLVADDSTKANESENAAAVMKAKDVTSALSDDVDKYIGEANQFDDITILSVQHAGETKAPTICFDINADFDEITSAVDRINLFLRDNKCPEYIIENADVVIDELCSNIAEYAYENKGGIIGLECRVNNNAMMLIFKDNGPMFDITKTADKHLPKEPEIGGLGIHLVKSLVDDLKYEYRDGINITTLMKVWNI